VERARLERTRLDVYLSEELVMGVDHLADRPLCLPETPRDDLLGRLGRALGRAEQLPGVVGRLALDHQDVDLTSVVAAPGDDDVERRLLDVLERRVDDPL